MDYKNIVNEIIPCLFDSIKSILVLKYILGYKLKTSLERSILCFFLIFFSIIAINYIHIPNNYTSIVYIPIIGVVVCIVFSQFNIKFFFNYILSYIFICEIDFLVSISFQIITNSQDSGLINEIVIMICSLIIILSLCYMFYHYHIKTNMIISKPIVLFQLITISLVSLLIGSISDISSNGSNIFSNKLIVLSISILSLIISSIGPFLSAILVSNSHQKNLLNINNKLLNLQISHYEELEQKNLDLRKFRHDLQGHIICLYRLIDEHKIQEALEYIDKIQFNISKNTSAKITGNDVIDAIINDKIKLAKINNISLQITGLLPQQLEIDNFSLCIIFLNALDNAIEACMRIKENRYIIVKIGYYNSFLHLSIENSTAYIKNYETLKLDKTNHGFGLNNIKQAVDSLNGSCTIHHSDNVFTIDVMIKC